MNTPHAGSINTPAVIAVMAIALLAAALFGSPTGPATAIPDSPVISQVAGR
jgi:hypothetical protein